MAGLVGGADGGSWAAETRGTQAGTIEVVGCAGAVLLPFEQLRAEVDSGRLHGFVYVVVEWFDGGLKVAKHIGRGERCEGRQQQRGKDGAHCRGGMMSLGGCVVVGRRGAACARETGLRLRLRGRLGRRCIDYGAQSEQRDDECA